MVLQLSMPNKHSVYGKQPPEPNKIENKKLVNLNGKYLETNKNNDKMTLRRSKSNEAMRTPKNKSVQHTNSSICAVGEHLSNLSKKEKKNRRNRSPGKKVMEKKSQYQPQSNSVSNSGIRLHQPETCTGQQVYQHGKYES